MTVTEKFSRKRISGVGWVNPLTHDFLLENSTYLKVYDSDNMLTPLTLGVDYTIAGIGDPAGYSVTITVPGSWTPDWWVLSVETPTDQQVDVSLGGSFGQRFETAIDAMARRMQVLADGVRRGLKLSKAADPTVEYTIPSPEARKVIGWNAGATNLQNWDNPTDSMEQAAASAAASAASAADAQLSEEAAAIEAADAAASAGAASASAAAALQAYNDTVAAITALGNPMAFKGLWDASAGTFPGGGTARAGWTYQVSVAGTVDGQVFDVNDRLIATVNNASATVYAANWFRAETDLVQSVAGLQGAVSASDLRGALDTPVYVTRAALPDLDTADDMLAYTTDFGYANWFQWSGADLSSRTVIQSVTTTTVVAATNICTKVAHLLTTTSGVTVTTAVNGLSLNTVYWVRAIDADTFTLHPTALDAYNNTNIFDLTGSTNFTLKQLRDPSQDVYVIKTGGQLDGTTGAWVQSRGAQHLGIGGASYERHFDKALFGGGAVGWLGDKAGLGSTGAGSWMGDEIAPGSAFAMSYLLVGAQVASVCNNVPGHPNCGVLGAARTPDGVSGRVGYGISGFFSGHSNGGGSVGWGAYIEGVKRPGSDTTVNAMEIEITNLNSTPVMPVPSPKSGYVQGRTFGILLASGGGNTGGMAYDADWAILVNQNGAKFRTGLIFHKDSLTPDAVTGWQHAIQLPTKARQEWFTSDANETVGFSITSEVTAAAKAQHIISRDDDVYYANNAGGLFFRMGVNTSASGNYVRSIASDAGTAVGLQALGADANISIYLKGRGTSGGSLQDGASAAKVAWDTTGVGFFGVAPVARGALAAPSGTITRTTFATGSVTLPQLAERVYAMINDLRAYGLFS